jgi:hypothetical protein
MFQLLLLWLLPLSLEVWTDFRHIYWHRGSDYARSGLSK